MCEVLGVSRSGFHAWLKRPISSRAAEDAKLVAAIDKSFRASDRTYGARRVWRDVLEDGLASGLHRIERLMRQNAMRARPKRRGTPKDDGQRPIIADNILDRDFEADRPNQKCPLGRLLRNRLPGDSWPTSLTSGRRRDGSMSPSCWISSPAAWSAPSRRLQAIACRSTGSMKADRDASLVMDALMMAVWRRGKADALLHHSDQGSQYTSEQFQRLLLDKGIICSMSRAGNVWDNSAMESGRPARSTAPAMPPAPMCSTISSGSIIRGDATRS